MKKRIFSLGLASVMAMAMSMPVFATVELPETETVQGSGNVLYADLLVNEVTVPTSEAYDFYIDPYGLADLANGEMVLTQELGNGAQILGGAPVPIINHSSYPLEVALSIKATGDPTYKATEAEATTDTEEFVLLTVMPSLTAMQTSDNFVESASAIPLDATTPVKFSFGLPAAKFTVTNNNGSYAVNEVAGTARGNGLLISGLLNKKYDWSDYESSKNMGIDVAISYDNLTETEYTELVANADTTLTAYGIGGDDAVTKITPVALPVATNKGPTITSTQTYQTSNGTVDTTIKVASLGSGTLEAKAVDQNASTVGVVVNGVYTPFTFADFVAEGLGTFTFSSTGTSNYGTLVIKKSTIQLGVVNSKTELVVTFRFTDADGVLMDRAPVAIVYKV